MFKIDKEKLKKYGYWYFVCLGIFFLLISVIVGIFTYKGFNFNFPPDFEKLILWITFGAMCFLIYNNFAENIYGEKK